jgi:hypothetical protein
MAIETIEKRPVPGLKHVYLIDWYDTGIFKEFAIVKEDEDGTLRGIDIDQMHQIDKVRLKKVITSVHADKYPLWQLMDQVRLPNGMNMLDFFHINHVKVKRPKGAVVSGSLSGISTSLADPLLGANFTDISHASAQNANETPSKGGLW